MHDDRGRNALDAGGRRRDPAPTQAEILHAWRWAGGMQPPYPGHWAVPRPGAPVTGQAGGAEPGTADVAAGPDGGSATARQGRAPGEDPRAPQWPATGPGADDPAYPGHWHTHPGEPDEPEGARRAAGRPPAGGGRGRGLGPAPGFRADPNPRLDVGVTPELREAAPWLEDPARAEAFEAADLEGGLGRGVGFACRRCGRAVRETRSDAGTLVCCGEPMHPIGREPDWRPDIPGPV